MTPLISDEPPRALVDDPLERRKVAGVRHSTALLLIVAIDQVLTFEARVRSLTGDAELLRAPDPFDAVGTSAEAVRDLVVHLDSYAVGEGRRQTGDAEPQIKDPHV